MNFACGAQNTETLDDTATKVLSTKEMIWKKTGLLFPVTKTLLLVKQFCRVFQMYFFNALNKHILIRFHVGKGRSFRGEYLKS